MHLLVAYWVLITNLGSVACFCCLPKEITHQLGVCQWSWRSNCHRSYYPLHLSFFSFFIMQCMSLKLIGHAGSFLFLYRILMFTELLGILWRFVCVSACMLVRQGFKAYRILLSFYFPSYFDCYDRVSFFKVHKKKTGWKRKRKIKKNQSRLHR